MHAEPSQWSATDPPPTSHAFARAATIVWLCAWLLLTVTAHWLAPFVAEVATRVEIGLGWADVRVGIAKPEEEGR